MEYTHPIDRALVRIRGLVIVLMIICAPVMLYTYGLIGVEVARDMGAWAIPVVIAHLVVWLGIASLLDTRLERRP